MKVFNVCMKVAKKNSTSILVYIIIMSLLAIISNAFTEKKESGFSGEEANYTVINRDGETGISRGLKKYLSGYGKEITLEDKKTVLQDALFYQATDYIIIIPEGFSKSFGSDRELKLQSMAVPGSANSYYVKNLVNKFLNMEDICRSSMGKESSTNQEELVLNILSENTDVTVKSYRAGKVGGGLKFYLRMYAYIILIIVLLSITTIMMVFKRPDLSMRNLCAPIKQRSFNMQTALCGGLISLLCWGILILVGLLLCHSEIIGLDKRILALLVINSFVFLAVGISIAFLAGMFVRSANMQDVVGNFTALSMAFLGGLFVPLELFSEQLKAAAHFVPSFWYSTALDKICRLNSFGREDLFPIYQAFLIQMGFAAAIFCVALAIAKVKNQSEKNFTTAMTEIEM